MDEDTPHPRDHRSYVLPVEDTEFLLRDEMRGFRFGMEYSKAELILRDWGVRSTIVVFGSARVPSPEELAVLQQNARSKADRARLGQLSALAPWYGVAREFAHIVSERAGALQARDGLRDNVIATGGGPGIMEAANRGARDAGAVTIGFNIRLPFEQEPNRHSTPELTFNFHYFAMRKMHLAMRANALAVFPGGFGTLDELFELLTLLQTRKAPRLPVLLFGEAFWRRIINFDALVEAGTINAEDLGLFCYAETAEDGYAALVERGLPLPEQSAG